ncbi:hypothetical protein V1511DRAFT_531387 [Dipodascopsis uninucleata]
MPGERVLALSRGDFPESVYEKIRALPNVESVTVIPGVGHANRSVPSREPTAEEWAEATILLTQKTLPPSRAAAPHIKYVQLFSAGSNLIVDMPFYKEAPEVVYGTASGTHGPPISEWVILAMLSFFHNWSNTNKWHSEGVWGSDADSERPQQDQYGRTISLKFTNYKSTNDFYRGILGYGGLGRQTGRLAKALGMRLVVHSFSTPPKKDRVEIAVPGSGDSDGSLPDLWFSGADQLDQFFSSGIDVLVLSVPLTPFTKKVIDKRVLNILKGAYIINVARGPVIDTDALIEAAESGLIAGAALDVTDPEPLPAGHKLWTTKNIIVSPHISGHSLSYGDRVTNIALHNIKMIGEEKPLSNLIDKSKGY